MCVCESVFVFVCVCARRVGVSALVFWEAVEFIFKAYAKVSQGSQSEIDI